MGNFFTSPKEEMAGTLTDLAMNGRLPKGWQSLIDESNATAKSGIVGEGRSTMATSAADTLSQAASMGLTSGVPSIIGANNAKIASGVGKDLGAVDVASMQQKLGSLGQLLQMGFGSMDNTSGFGDLMAGLTSVANIGAGIVGMGGRNGLGWWGGGSTPDNQKTGAVLPTEVNTKPTGGGKLGLTKIQQQLSDEIPFQLMNIFR